MFHKYQIFFICLLLLPVAINIFLPLAMTVVWLCKKALLGTVKKSSPLKS